ncbi:MAG: UvrD-helicase domain-containing protein [Planctomycetia bacterium]|nr:UvrD-helicase domain-containing protein [Planctomycetia bacterium]
MDDFQTNIQVRLNVVSYDRIQADVTRFQQALNWEELYQYIRLFWMLRRGEVMKDLTDSQRAERKHFQDFRIAIKDPYLGICDAHRFLLPPVPRTLDDTPVTLQPVCDEPTSLSDAPSRACASLVTPQNRVILAQVNEHQLVIAPPGTGKTHAVIQRLVQLAGPNHLRGDLSTVLVVSFSRAAAAELSQRLALEMVRREGAIYQHPRISTLDSLTGVLLGSLLSNGAQTGYDANVRLLAQILEGGKGAEVQAEAVRLIRQRVRLVVIDEVQDVVGVRARLIRNLLSALSGTKHGVLILGDLRQAIYGFALEGMPLEERSMDAFWLIRELKVIYNDLELLAFTEQFRFSHSCKRLMVNLQTAMDDQAGNKLPGEHPDRNMLRSLLEEQPVLEDPLELANEDSRKTRVAILARTNREVRQLEVGCSILKERFNRPLKVVAESDGRGYPGWIGRVFGSLNTTERYTRAGFLEAYATRVSRTVNEASKNLDWLTTAFSINANGFLLNDIIEGIDRNPVVPTDLREQPQAGEVWISTIHQAKGREFDVVVIANLDRILDQRSSDPEECRLAYVAATRARREVYRCSGSYWLPNVFNWKFEFFDIGGLNDAAEVVAQQEFVAMQEALWREFRRLGRLRIHYAGDGRFGLEVAGLASTWKFGPGFTVEFADFVRKHLGVEDALNCQYSVRIIDVRTFVTGNPAFPFVLLPELSGCIERIGNR